MKPVDLEDFLPFLINRVSARITASFTAAIADTGLSLADVRAMSALYFKPGMRLVELAAATDGEISTLSRLVRRLARKGFCIAETRGADGRLADLSLAPAGRAVIARLERLGARHERALRRGLTAHEIRTAKDLLRKIHRNALGPW